MIKCSEYVSERHPDKVADYISQYLLDRYIYASMCRWGLFGEFQQDKVWEKVITNK
jgi:S-adenosylmethionine synthetase